MTNKGGLYPTDYGPDTSGPLARALQLPPEQRPPLAELRKMLRARRPKVEAEGTHSTGPKELEEAWQAVPETAPDDYICGGSALNIPDPVRGGGDWHFCGTWVYMKPVDAPPRFARRISEEVNNPVMEHVLRHVLGTDRVLDVRAGLRKMGHPQADSETAIWAASHERSTLEYVLRSVLDHDEPTVNRYRYMLDQRTFHRWIATDEQEQWVWEQLIEIAGNLPERRAWAIHRWIEQTLKNPEQ